MDPLTIALLALRGVSTVMDLQGRSEVGNAIRALLAAHQAGRNVDAHMQEIADQLDAGLDLAPWDDISARIQAETKDFLETPMPPADESGG